MPGAELLGVLLGWLELDLLVEALLVVADDEASGEPEPEAPTSVGSAAELCEAVDEGPGAGALVQPTSAEPARTAPTAMPAVMPIGPRH